MAAFDDVMVTDGAHVEAAYCQAREHTAAKIDAIDRLDSENAARAREHEKAFLDPVGLALDRARASLTAVEDALSAAFPTRPRAGHG